MFKLLAFFIISWIGTCMVGAAFAGGGGLIATSLTADITATDTTVHVTSTTGWPGGGRAKIGNEEIYYFDTTSTTFKGTAVPPHTLERGYNGTEATSHLSGEKVASVPL